MKKKKDPQRIVYVGGVPVLNLTFGFEMEDQLVIGEKKMAYHLGVKPRQLRNVVKTDDAVARTIMKSGGRFFGLKLLLESEGRRRKLEKRKTLSANARKRRAAK